MMIHMRKILLSALLSPKSAFLTLAARLLFVAAASFSIIAAPAFAEGLSYDRSERVYVKGSIGEFNWINFCSNVAAERGESFIPKCDDTVLGYGGIIGYRFSPFLGIEAGGHYAEGFEIEGGVPGSVTQFKQDRQYQAYTIGGVGYWPFDGEVVVLSGRAGFHYWNTEENTSPNSTNSSVRAVTVNNESTDFYYGGGVELRFSSYFSLGVDYTRYVVENDNSLDKIAGKIIVSF